MADFKQAIKWLREGKKVRRGGWYKELVAVNADCIRLTFEDRKSNLGLGCADCEATDWEIYEEEKKESLSDKIMNSFGYPEGTIKTQDVKEKIQNAQRRLKEDLLINGTYHRVINEKVDKVFQEEFGDKLIKLEGQNNE